MKIQRLKFRKNKKVKTIIDKMVIYKSIFTKYILYDEPYTICSKATLDKFLVSKSLDTKSQTKGKKKKKKGWISF